MATRVFNLGTDPDRPVVLFVDDDAGNRQAFHATFRRSFEVLTASGFEEAWQFLSNRPVDVIITDQRMPGTTGSQLLSLVRERFPQVRRMLVTAYSDIQAVIDAVNLGGVTNYIAKPWDPGRLEALVMAAHAEVKAERQREQFTQQLVEANRQLEFALRQRLLS